MLPNTVRYAISVENFVLSNMYSFPVGVPLADTLREGDPSLGTLNKFRTKVQQNMSTVHELLEVLCIHVAATNIYLLYSVWCEDQC